MAFNFSNGDTLDKKYLKESDLIDNYIGNRLWAWGLNNHGQLGNNATGNYNGSPLQTISGGTNWKQTSTGYYHIAGIKTDGTLWLWGDNRYYGQLGDNTTTKKSSPVQTISGGNNWNLVSCGSYYTTTIKTDGTLWLWGRNNVGQLGTNNTTNYSSPVQTIAAGNNWKKLSAGFQHVAAIKTDGTLWLWGQNNNGQLGDNTLTNKSSPAQTFGTGNNWNQVSVGSSFTAAIKTDGTLWLCGNNQYGQLGDNTTTNKSSPVQTIAGGNNWKSVSASIGGHISAIKTDGTLWLFGNNGNAQLGDNTTVSKSSPVQTITGGTNWKSVATGSSHTAAIKTNGELWLWGSDAFGQLGTNTFTSTSSPVQTISSGTNWKQVSCGYLITSATTFSDLQ